MSRLIHFRVVLTIGLVLSATNTFAQGTATGPSTSHVVDPTSIDEVWIGGINDPVYGPDPFPIDLDLTGAPWVKDVHNTPAGDVVGGSVTIHETIQNVGTEPWTDWHEISFSGGTAGADWDSVLDLRVNSSSITFSSSIVAGLLTLDNFLQPVLPGDVFEIDKTMLLTGSLPGANGLLFRIAEFPTTNVPEPATWIIVAFALLSISFRCIRRV